jgi:hypothetical protein
LIGSKLDALRQFLSISLYFQQLNYLPLVLLPEIKIKIIMDSFKVNYKQAEKELMYEDY